jgi:hypothetical protein
VHDKGVAVKEGVFRAQCLNKVHHVIRLTKLSLSFMYSENNGWKRSVA